MCPRTPTSRRPLLDVTRRRANRLYRHALATTISQWQGSTRTQSGERSTKRIMTIHRETAAGTTDPSAASTDRETVAADQSELRLWLRLLTCTTLIENEVSSRLRTTFDTTLPRFDLMAQLARFPDGLGMGELSQRLMVSGGNITSITD